jgi:NAD(P)-dependent dehydrogenase (short-subunit alcohol dehydrogenase family)
LANAFAECGGEVVIGDIFKEKAQAVANEVNENGGISFPIQVDVTEIESIKNMVKKTMEHCGKIDILLNSAGVNVRKPAENFTENDWDKIINVNLKGAFFVSQEVGKQMIKQNNGKIINISSDDAEIGHSTLSIYSASKAGIVAFTKVLAKEWAKYNINVNSIGPGYILTELTKDLLKNKQKYDNILSEIPAGRLGTTQDVAKAALFLASEFASYITGQTIFVEGGRLIG